MQAAWDKLDKSNINIAEYLTLLDLDMYLNNDKPTHTETALYGHESFPLSLCLYEPVEVRVNGRRRL